MTEGAGQLGFRLVFNLSDFVRYQDACQSSCKTAPKSPWRSPRKHQEPRPFQGGLSEPLPSSRPHGGTEGVKGPVRTANNPRAKAPALLPREQRHHQQGWAYPAISPVIYLRTEIASSTFQYRVGGSSSMPRGGFVKTACAMTFRLSSPSSPWRDRLCLCAVP